MSYWYSPSDGRFGLVSWGSKKRPADAVDISAEQHAALFPPGEPQREIETGPDGLPRWKVASIEEQRTAAIAAVKREARLRIEAIFPIHKQLNAMRDGRIEEIGFARIDAIRAASGQIEEDITASASPTDIPVTTHPYWPEFED